MWTHPDFTQCRCDASAAVAERNRSGAIGLSIDICISYHNRYFNIVIFNIRVSIRVRGLHLVPCIGNVIIPTDDLHHFSEG